MAPNVTITAIEEGRTSLVLSVRLLGGVGAHVMCAAIAGAAGTGLASPVAVQSSPFMSFVIGDSGVVTISQLTPATVYSVYCSGLTTQGVHSSLAAVAGSFVSATTLCCKTVTVSIATPSMRAGQTSEAALVVTVDAPPSQQLRVELALMGKNGTQGPMTVFPSSVVFHNSSRSLHARVLLAAVDAGWYELTATIVGASAGEYSLSYASARTVIVLAGEVSPPVPAARLSRFSSDGSRVMVDFDAATDRAGYDSNFPCPALLMFPGSAQSTCFWISASAFVVFPKYAGTGTTLAPGDTLVLKAGVLRAACSGAASAAICGSYATLPESSLAVEPPVMVTRPSVILAVPSSLSGCSALTVDATESLGSMGRPWTSATFSVRTAAGVTQAALQLEALLMRDFSIDKLVTTVPYTDFQKGYTYSLQLTLCNFLGGCSSSVRSVSVLPTDAAVPVVQLAGPGQVHMLRRNDLVVTAEAFAQSCEGVRSYKSLALAWSIALIGFSEAEAPLSLKSLSQNAATFRLAAYTLAAGQQYRVALSARSLVSDITSSAQIEVTVMRSQLVAMLNVGPQAYLTVGADLVLDAGSSYDEDAPPNQTGTASGLAFAWSCTQAQPKFNRTCPVIVSIANGSGQARMSVSAPSSGLGRTALVTVTVSDSTRSSSAQVLITVTGSRVPEIAIATQPLSARSVDIGSQLTLLGTVQTAVPCSASWSVDHKQVQLSTVALTALAKHIPSSSASVPFNLVAAKNALPPRSTLRFSLSCGATVAWLTVTTNGAPLPGEFSVSPPSGTELLTQYAFWASFWADEDLPLTYQFGFVSPSNGARLSVGGKTTSAHAESLLPAGSTASGGYRVNCTLGVYDTYGASTDAFNTVVVSPVPAAEKAQAMQDALEGATGSVANAQQIIAVVASAVAAVDCTGAGNCTALHRSGCASVAGMCGPCLPGYSGDSGLGNTPCLSSVQLAVEPGRCTSNSQCAATWQHCDIPSQRCVANQKGCVANCTGHGQCVFANRYSGLRVDRCPVTDQSCEGVCACHDDYSGAACDILAADLDSQRQIRGALVTSLLSLTEAEDVNEVSTASWAATLSAVAFKPQELYPEDRVLVLSLANRTLQSALSTGATSAALYVGVLEALDSVTSLLGGKLSDSIDRQAYTTELSSATTLQVLTAFADLQARSLALGLNSTSFTYENFRLAAQVVSLDPASGNITLASPRSVSEIWTGSPPSSSVLVPSAAGYTATTVTGRVLVVYPRVFARNTSAFESNPFILQLRSDGVNSPNEALSGVSFALQHIQPALTDITTGRSINLTTVCTDRNDSAVFVMVCPGSGVVLRHNCSRGPGTHVSYCPVLGPSCASLNTATGELGSWSDCRVVRYTEETTECYCANRLSDAAPVRRLSPAAQTIPGLRGGAMSEEQTGVAETSGGERGSSDQGRRSLLVAGDIMTQSGGAAIVATADYLHSDFEDTFQYANDVTTVDALKRTYIVIAMVCALWGAGAVPLLREAVTPSLGIAKGAAVAPAQMSAKQRVLNYVNHVIPAVFASDEPVLRRFAVEILRHHSFFKMWESETRRKRQQTVFKFLTSFTFMVFLVAVFYDQGSPDDDGTCLKLSTKEECLSRKSPFDPNKSFCEWTPSPYDPDRGRCSFAEQGLSVREIVYSSLLVTIIQSIMTIPNEYLFGIMMAPTTHSLKGAAKAKDSAAAGDDDSPSGSSRSSRRGSTIVPLIPDETTGAAAAESSSKKSAGILQAILPDSSEETVLANRRIPSAVSRSRRLAGLSLSTVSVGAAALSEQLTRTTSILKSRSSKSSFRTSRSSILRGLSSDSIASSGDSVRGAELTGFASEQSPTLSRQQRDAVVMDQVTSLCDDVIYQRLLMRDQSRETQVFDAQWGLVKGGEDLEEGEAEEEGYWFQASALKTFHDEIRTAGTESDRLQKVLHHCSEQHAGVELLHVFMVDLLGRHTPAAKIFREKFEEEYESSPTVTLLQSYLATAFLLGVNAFIVYYLILKGYQKGLHWQMQFLWSCIAQISVEIFVFETIECIWLNYSVPAFVNNEVTAAVAILRELIQRLVVTSQLTAKSAKRRQAVVDAYFLNAPSHLFVSTKLAAYFPNLLESMIVNSFVHHLPGKMCLTWPHYRSYDAYQSCDGTERLQRGVARGTALAVAFTALLVQGVLTVPFGYQKVFIRVVQPMVFSGMALLWYSMSSSTPVLIVLCVVFAALLLLLFRCHAAMYHEPHGSLAQVVPLDATSASERTFVPDVEAPSRKLSDAADPVVESGVIDTDAVVSGGDSGSGRASDESSDGRYSCSTSSVSSSDSDKEEEEEEDTNARLQDVADEAGVYSRHANELVRSVLERCRASYQRQDAGPSVSMSAIEEAAERTKLAAVVVSRLLQQCLRDAPKGPQPDTSDHLERAQAAAVLQQEAAALMEQVVQQCVVRGVDAMLLRRAQACTAEATSLVSVVVQNAHEKATAAAIARAAKAKADAQLCVAQATAAFMASGIAQFQGNDLMRRPVPRKGREVLEDVDGAIWSSSSSSAKASSRDSDSGKQSNSKKVPPPVGESKEPFSAAGSGSESEASFGTMSSTLSASALQRALHGEEEDEEEVMMFSDDQHRHSPGEFDEDW